MKRQQARGGSGSKGGTKTHRTTVRQKGHPDIRVAYESTGPNSIRITSNGLDSEAQSRVRAHFGKKRVTFV